MSRGTGLLEQDTRPSFVPVDSQTGTEVKLDMQSIWLTGRVQPVGARLLIRHAFVPAGNRPTEIVYAFVLPRDAALRRFRIAGEGFVARSELRPVEEARKQYEEGIAKGNLATLVQQYRDGYVNLSVGNIRPGELVTVHLEILAGVDLYDDYLRFRFPFTLAPCYHPRMRVASVEAGTGELELPEDEFGDLLLPAFKQDAKNLHEVGFDLSVVMPEDIAEVRSPSHALSVKTVAPRRVRIGLARERDLPNRDLVLDARMKGPYTGVVCGTAHERVQFAGIVASCRLGKATASPRRLVFLLDRSGSMEGEPITQARNAVLACVAALQPQDQVGFVAFDDETTLFRPGLAMADNAMRDELRRFVEQVEARGGTELLAGIRAAAQLLGKEGGDIFVLTDGQVAATEDITQQAKALGIRLHCLGIGSASQDRFLTLLARETGGVSRFVTPRERVDAAALELFAAVGRPVATEVKVHVDGMQDSVITPEPPTVVFGSHPLVVHGEAEVGEGHLVVEWRQEGKRQSLSLPVYPEQHTDAVTLRLLRGARLITDLENRLVGTSEAHGTVARERQRIERMLEELGREYGLANRRLALVAVVARAGDRPEVVPQTRVVPVGLPEDVELESYFRSCRSRPPACACYEVRATGVLYRRATLSVGDQALAEGPATPPPSDEALNTLMEWVKKLEADGGLPGSSAEERICASTVLLLAILAYAEATGSRLFAPQVLRLTEFLNGPVTAVLTEARSRKLSNVVVLAYEQRALPGPWLELLADRRPWPSRMSEFWKALSSALKSAGEG